MPSDGAKADLCDKVRWYIQPVWTGIRAVAEEGMG